MTKVEKGVAIKRGIIDQLHNMLTNHKERPHHTLNVEVLGAKSGVVVEKDKIVIYANEPVSKIEEKVKKMREEGNYYTICISDLHLAETGEYYLSLLI